MTDPTFGGADAPEDPGGDGQGEQIGPFRILKKIGAGGFGVVFEAEQEHPVKRRVALKVIKLGMDTHEVIARFESERQALAMMDHPHIARVLDAGATENGRPYFVMELVDGQPISSYCDAQQLSIIDRLTLFDQVCTTVQHAHTKGIIHRDLKPSNVLVSTVDGAPFAKIIDFGIAKATSGRLTDRTLLTELNQVLGTPLYMSPEQAEGSSDIDTRTDIYSLGVMLYELLTGTTPVESASLRSAVFAEIQRIIREVDPPRPSIRLSEAPTTRSGVATRRATEPRKLTRMVRGELDWIVMKAIEKDRTRRYETANGLALDVRRYLSGEPVFAAPPSASYRLQKLVRRHKGAVAAGSLIAASLLVGIVGFAWQARIAKARADELEQVSRFQAAMLEQVDPTEAGKLLSEDVRAKFEAVLVKAGVPEPDRARQVAAFAGQWERVNLTDAARDLIDRTILKPAVGAIEAQFKDQPLVDSALRDVLAGLYVGMGMYDVALPLEESALATRRRVLGEKHPLTLASITNLGIVLMQQGKLDEAETQLRDALDKRRRVLGEDHADTLTTMTFLGRLLKERGKLEETERYAREVLKKRRRVLGEDHPDTLISINNLGTLLYAQGKVSEAETYIRESLDKSRRLLGEEHSDTIASINNLASLLHEQGKLREAEPLLRESLEKHRRVNGEEHPDTLNAMANLGVVLQNAGKLAEAEGYLTEALNVSRRVLGDDHPHTLTAMNNLGLLLQVEGKWSEAEPHLRETLSRFRRVLGDEHPDSVSSMSNLGALLLAEQKLSEAEPYLREALAMRRRLLGEDRPDTLVSISFLGALLVAQRKYREAERMLVPMEPASRAAFPGEDAARLGAFLMFLGKARTGLGELAAAETNLLEAQPILLKMRGPKHKSTRDCTQALIDLYAAWNTAERGKGYDVKAAEWKLKL